MAKSVEEVYSEMVFLTEGGNNTALFMRSSSPSKVKFSSTRYRASTLDMGAKWDPMTLKSVA